MKSRSIKLRTSLSWNFGISNILVEITQNRTSFKTIISKKAATVRMIKQSINDKLLQKIMPSSHHIV